MASQRSPFPPSPPRPWPLPLRWPPSTLGHRLHQPDRPRPSSSLIAPPRRVGAGRIVPARRSASPRSASRSSASRSTRASLRRSARPRRRQLLLASLGLAIDLLAIALPSAAAQLWRRPPLGSPASRPVDLAYSLMMTLSPHGLRGHQYRRWCRRPQQGRSEATGLAADCGGCAPSAPAITELRSVATIEAGDSGAHLRAAVWRQNGGLQRHHAGGIGRGLRPRFLKLRQALGAAQRRDTTDTGLRNASPPRCAAGDSPPAIRKPPWRPISWPGRAPARVSLHAARHHRPLRITGLTIKSRRSPHHLHVRCDAATRRSFATGLARPRM